MLITRTLFSVLAVLCWIGSTAQQVTINEEDFYEVGDTIDYHVMDTTGVSSGPSGANVTWDFSDVNASGTSPQTIYIKNPSNTPYGSDYPNATRAQALKDSSDYSYEDINNGRYIVHGAVTQVQAQGQSTTSKIFFDNTQIAMEAPVSYNQTSIDTFAGTVENAGSGNLDRSGVIESEADGYGTIILPNGNQFNALRQKIVKKTIDSAEVNGLTQVSKAQTITYNYYIEEQKGYAFAINIIIDSTFLGGGLMSSGKTKSVRMPDVRGDGFDNEPDDPVTGLFSPLKDQNKGVSIYPNPVTGNEMLTVEPGEDKTGTVQLMNVDGSALQKREFNNSNRIRFNTEGLTSGMYLIKIITEEGGYSTKKVQIK